ncbi:conserved hypothetical protein [Histoplasma capsulatum var. duboisii H88]|uniref:Ubiquitin 3 binding protein But2 C-terminal domain-containing protein n=2 Tax=Ajellomyces capsulatus TaxID=5037 RepID=F0UC66_AJEC8|nr:conserved hypothetical protein [Histoplasma capsulatum H143]EGC43166.1 conserved hypothetical protein [Histoplasma capsulatum var. duboisii H88]
MLVTSPLTICMALLFLLRAAIAAPSNNAEPVLNATLDLSPSGANRPFHMTFDVLSKKFPDQPFLTNTFHVERAGGENVVMSAFTVGGIGSNMTNCTLWWRKPSSRDPFYLVSGQNRSVDIWTTKAWYPEKPRTYPTWHNPPKKRHLLKQIVFPTTAGKNKILIGSIPCRHTLSFLGRFSPGQPGDAITWWLNEPGIRGFYLVAK